jgi:PAS domain S-box-containing protein
VTDGSTSERSTIATSLARYVFGVAVALAAYLLRRALEPLTGTGAPFVLFFGAVVVSSLKAGTGPAILTTLLGAWLGAYSFVVRAGYSVPQAVSQAALFSVDGAVVIFLSSLMTRARRAAELGSARFRDLIDLAPDAFFLADLGGRFMDVNQAACRLLGCQREELLGKTILDVIPPEDAPRLAAVRAALLVPGRVERSEWTMRWKDGPPIPVEVSANILPDGRWQAFIRDISERRRVEDERQVLISLLENSPDFIGIADPTGKPVYLNPAGRRMVGLPPDLRIEQTRIPDYYPPEVRPFAEGVILAEMLAHGRWSGETSFRNWQTGESIPVSDEHFVIRDPTGSRLIGFGTVTRDISQVRRTAREREELLARERLARRDAESVNRQLRESEERFRLTIDEAPIGMALVALDGRFVRVNGALCQIVGYTAPELERLRFQDITHPEDLDSDVELANRLARGEIPRYQLEKRYLRKDGAVVWILLSASVLRGPGEAPLYYIAQIEDVTERKRAADALRESEARFSGIVSLSADAIISVDEAQRIVLFNDAAERIFGHARADVLGAPLDVLIPEAMHDLHRRQVTSFAQGNVTSRPMGGRPATIMGLRKNGEQFPAEAAISKLRVGDRTILTVALRDVTERKRAEERQQLLAEVGAVMGASLDCEETLVTLARLLVRELADFCIVDLVPKDEHPRRLTVVSRDPERQSLAARLQTIPLDRTMPHLALQALATREPLGVERVTPELLESLSQSPEHLEILRAIDPRSVMALPLSLRGQLLGALVLLSTTPSRVYRPDDLRAAETIADRAAVAIDNGRLYEAAVHATRLRDEVMAIVAHDLRNPLSAILMQAEAMQRRGGEPERRSARPREAILKAGVRMQRLIRDLLDVSLIEAGKMGVEREPLSVRELIADTVDSQRALAASAALSLEVELEPDLPAIAGDRHRLQQVVENLVSNALKFTPHGGHITIGAARRPGEVLFWVADTGLGIPEEAVPHVFDRFWQVKRAARAGAGLGLAISRGIVEAHGGRIWVESTLGRGTVFFFTIPESPEARAALTAPGAAS